MATIPSEWQAAIQWLVSRFTSTAVYAEHTFRESELDGILPAWRNRDALFEYLEHARAVSPKRAGHYTEVLPDLGSADDPATHITNRCQMPLSLELRDIRPAILELAPVTTLDEKQAETCATTPAHSANSGRSSRGEASAKIEAYLSRHHDYDSGRVGNYHPAESADIVTGANVPKGTVSGFLRREFPSSGSPRVGYVAACRSKSRLLLWFRTKHGDQSPLRTDDLSEYDEGNISRKW